MKQTMGMSIAVMALLGHASAIDVEKHHSQQSNFNIINNKEKEFIELEDDEEENDAFMAESIREAEAEYKKNKAGTDVNREIFRQGAEEAASLEASQEKTQTVAPELKKTTDEMTQDMIDGALNSKSIMSVSGSGDVDVHTRDVEQEAKETANLNKQAIHAALSEVTAEIDSTNKVAKKETPVVVVATDKDKKDKDVKKEADKKKEAVPTPVTPPVVTAQKKNTPPVVTQQVATTVTTPSTTTAPGSTTISIPVGDLAQKKTTPVAVTPTENTPKTPFAKVGKTTEVDVKGTTPDLAKKAAPHISQAQISSKKSKKHHHKQEDSSSDSSSDSDSGDEEKHSSVAQKPNVIKQFIQEFTDVTKGPPKDNAKIQTKQISLSEQEDKDIQESIEFAEKSMGQKLELNRKTPGKLFEGISNNRIDSSMISSLIESETTEGDCDIKDMECQSAFHASLNLGQKKKEGPSIGLLALAQGEDAKAKKAEPAKPAAEAPKAAPAAEAPKAEAPKAAAPVKAVAVGDLNETPVPNGPHTTKTVQNGNSTTAAIVTQPFVIGNGPAAISTAATPLYPSTTGKLGYAQINAPTAVAVGDLNVTPVPSGAHTSKVVDNGNATTAAIVTQPFYIGNSVASESTAKTPTYPVASKDQLGYAQVTTPGSIGPPGIVPTGAHTSGDSVIGNHTTDAFTTQKRYIGTAPPAISENSTPSYPSPVKLGYNQTATKAQALAEESHSDSDSGSESDQEKDFVDPKNFIQTKVQHPRKSLSGVTFF